MRSAVTAFILCTFAATAGANTISQKQTAVPAVATVAAPQASAPTLPSEVIVKSAGAVTHDGSPSARSGTSSGQTTDDEHPHTGMGMLLAALALMLGIAWRRFSASEQ